MRELLEESRRDREEMFRRLEESQSDRAELHRVITEQQERINGFEAFLHARGRACEDQPPGALRTEKFSHNGMDWQAVVEDSAPFDPSAARDALDHALGDERNGATVHPLPR